MRLKSAVVALAIGMVAACGAPAGGAVEARIEVAMADQPWPAFYQRAGELFEAGQRDEAVVLFYIGQLRGRIAATCQPGRADGAPALLASLNATLGQTINEYAGGSPSGWAAAMEQALAWDAAHPDPNADGSRCRAERERQRAGLGQLRDQVIANAASIRRERAANGLPNR